ncbi:MAG: FUSC family protein [Verrucomicrobium sp.]|nr:FUSC family protein [Verrucomicrobium sp.]
MPHPLAVDLTSYQKGNYQWRAAFLRVPALALALAIGHGCGQPAAGVLGCAAALSAGFGGMRQVRGSRLLAMMWTVGTMAAAAWLGTVCGHTHGAALAVTALGGFVCGLVVVYNDDLGWIAIQGVIALLLATNFPSYGEMGAARSVAILAGGALQVGVLLLLWRFLGISRRGPEEGGMPVPPQPWREAWAEFRQSWVFTSVAFRYALRLALTLMLAIGLARYLGLQNGYWLPMTTLLVLKPDFYRTYAMGVQRSVGTLLGVGLASVIAEWLAPGPEAAMGLAVGFGLLVYALQKVNMVLFCMMLTSYVVFLISLTGMAEGEVTVHRLINTVLGCGLAMGSRFIGLRLLRWRGKRLVPSGPTP